MALLIQSPAAFHKTRRNDSRQQQNESTTFRERSAGHPDHDQSGNPNSNPGSLLTEATEVQGSDAIGIIESLNSVSACYSVI